MKMPAWFNILIPFFHYYILGMDTHIKVPENNCPPIRDSCPKTYDWYDKPQNCEKDEDCNTFRDKCCFDVCLDQKVCKPGSIND